MHQLMASTLDEIEVMIRRIQHDARTKGFTTRPRWPMIVLRSPKGWTGPKEVDGKLTEGTFRSHQVPMAEMDKPGHVELLEGWLKSYKPEELFDDAGRLVPELASLAPAGERRMGAIACANGGSLLRDLHMPDFRQYAVPVVKPGGDEAEATRVQGLFLRDVLKTNTHNFRVFGPDQTASNGGAPCSKSPTGVRLRKCSRPTNMWPMTDASWRS